ncbi:hypothetical protein Hanom_Chr02g00114481 [Helianthus anomalus]
MLDAEVNVADVEVNVAEVEGNEENALVLAQLFVLVGDLKNVSYSREDNARRIEVERRRLKEKEAKKAQVDKKVDEENDDEDEEDDDLKDIDDFSWKTSELVENWTRESMLEVLGMNDEKFKFDVEDEIPTAPESEYVLSLWKL